MDNIYDRYIAIAFEIVFFGTPWRLWKIVFDEKAFKIVYLCFPFFIFLSRTGSGKSSHVSGVVGCRKLTDSSLSNVFNILQTGL